LVKALQFHQAVIECAAVGMIVVDDDTRIINANPALLDIVDKSSADVINRPVSQLFDEKSRAKLSDGLKLVMQKENLEKISFLTTFHSQVMKILVSPIKLAGSSAGCVIVIEPVSQDNRGLRNQ
jgi:PAS domain S-box-containing protein